MVASLFSCGNNEEPITETTEETIATEEPARLIELIAYGHTSFQIVRPEDGSETVSQAAIALRQVIQNFTGVKLEMVSDLYSKNVSGYEDRCEILIGRTAYDETAQVLATCGYSDYAMAVIGNKIVITSYDDTNLQKACDAFSSALLKKEKGDTITFTEEELTVRRSANMVIAGVPIYEGAGEASVLDCADNSYMLLVEKADRAGYDAYCNKLTAAGYSLYHSHTESNNHFATYVSETHQITMYFAPKRKQVRVMVEKLGALPPVEQVEVNKIVDPSVTMLGLEYDGNQIGLGIIFQMSDGSFIIFDGGNNKASYMNRFYAKLKSLAPDPNNIHVRAWFFSHAHTDHVGTFLQFTSAYCNKIQVDQFVFNFGTNAVYDSITSGANRGLSAEVRTAVKKWTNSEVVKAHTGQVFQLADAKVEILYTGEDVYPVAWRDGNTESLVFRVTLGGQTILCLGDEYLDSSDILCSMYSNSLKSDILQASHHGRNGATLQLVSLISAPTVLWPGGYGNFMQGDKLYLRDYNVRMLALCKDLYIAGSQGVTLKLPYTVLNNKDSVMSNQ